MIYKKVCNNRNKQNFRFILGTCYFPAYSNRIRIRAFDKWNYTFVKLGSFGFCQKMAPIKIVLTKSELFKLIAFNFTASVKFAHESPAIISPAVRKFGDFTNKKMTITKNTYYIRNVIHEYLSKSLKLKPKINLYVK